MSNKYITDQSFQNIDFSERGNEKTDYENCTFSACIFSNTNLGEFCFEDCEFENCDFSNTKILNTAFKNVQFKACKLIGLQFDECNPFLLELKFNHCILNYSSFYQRKLKATKFNKCTLHEVDFTEADLNKANFTECDFSGAMFGRTNLRQANFKSSYNFSIDPEQNQIAGAKFSLDGLPGLLQKYKIVVD
ncbi:pentapeptide repeat-containing protein [Prolixibacteraceae bacterium Z1-6]|uniref:Pentapeptide repeat-containing protein n=1 Tax=Draconibacterium aestuarii TaxID=2998507 RepID=A0A9X3J839_9BACT|nr:pentapeptide repeat-containing protein [Prolixibacteraceae bacterium Z1-6]